MSAPPSLFRRTCRIITLGLVMVSLIGAAAYLFRDRLLQDLVRPLLVEELTRRVQGQVRIERLLLAADKVRAEGLYLEKAGLGRLDLDSLELTLGWGILRERTLPHVLLNKPKLTLHTPATDQEPDTGGTWLDTPPFGIDDLEIRVGEILPPLTGAPHWRVDVRGKLGRQWSVSLRLEPGNAAEQTLEVESQGSWAGTIGGTVDRLRWRGDNLLGEPLRFELGQSGPIALGGVFQLGKLSDDELRTLLPALGLTLPEGNHWQLEKLRVSPSLADGKLRLELQLDSFGAGERTPRTLLRELRLTGQSSADQALGFEATAQLATNHDPVALAGELGWAGPLTLSLVRCVWRGQPLLTEPLRLSFADQDSAFSGGLRLAQLDDRAVRPLLALADIQLPAEPQWSLRDLEVEPAWDKEQLHLAVTAKSLVLRSGARGLSLGRTSLVVDGRPGDWQLHGTGQLDAGNRFQGELSLRGASLAGQIRVELADLAGLAKGQPDLPVQALAGALTLDAKLSGSLDHPGIVIKAATRSLSLAGQADFPSLDLQVDASLSRPKQRWQLSAGRLNGNLSGTLTGTLSGSFAGSLEGSDWSASLAELKFKQLAWTAPDGLSAYASELLSLQGEIAAKTAKPVSFELRGELNGGELLRGSYYASLQDYNTKFAMRGEVSAGACHLESARLELPQFGELTLTGLLAPDDLRLNAHLELPDLQLALDHQGRNLLVEPYPALKDLSLSGGLSIDAVGERSQRGWNLRLDVAPAQIAIQYGEQIRLTGLNGKIPLLSGTLGDAENRSGRLAWSNLSIGPLGSGPGELAILSRLGQVQLPGQLPFDFSGGLLALSGLSFDMPPQEMALAASLRVSGVDLQTLTRELHWPEMNGALSADLGRLRYHAGELSISGDAGIEVFGGRIRVGQMRAHELFTPYPVFDADIDFSGIDLLRLTNTLSFGEMNGLIDGHIHQLRLFGVTPTHFEASLQTRDSGTRNISVKALNNLTILSQGGLSAALSRGIYRFIDFYRYRSIGIACSLENDLFRLRGTALEGSDNYLVYGGLLPPQINVITSSQTVSFREMVKRLKRLDRAGNSGAPR